MKPDSNASEPTERKSELGTVFLDCRAALMRFIGRFVHGPQDIEDIVHETFLRTHAAEIHTQIRSPKAFLFRTARNLALKHIARASYRLTDYLEDFDAAQVLVDEASTERRVEAEEQFAAFCRSVRTLPLQCRRAFILRKVYGLTHREIADHLGISVSTVEKHLATGIVRCTEYMRTHGYISAPAPAGRRKRGAGS